MSYQLFLFMGNRIKITAFFKETERPKKSSSRSRSVDSQGRNISRLAYKLAHTESEETCAPRLLVASVAVTWVCNNCVCVCCRTPTCCQISTIHVVGGRETDFDSLFDDMRSQSSSQPRAFASSNCESVCLGS